MRQKRPNLLGLGAVLFVAAALSGTDVVQKRPDGG